MVLTDFGHLHNLFYSLNSSGYVGKMNSQYRELDSEIKNSDFLYQVIKLARGSIVILDPDVIFWDTCEGFLITLVQIFS